MSLVEYGGGAARGGGGGGGERDLSRVECGQPFYLEVQALDRFSNKCGGGGAGRGGGRAGPGRAGRSG